MFPLSALPTLLASGLAGGAAAGGMTSPIVPPGTATAPVPRGTAPPPVATTNPLMARFSQAMSNPLFGAGVGLLSQGPSLTPQSPFAGIGAGLQMSAQHAALQREQERAAAELKMRQDEMAMRRQQAEQQLEADRARRAAQTSALVAGGMDAPQAARLVAAGAAERYLKPPTSATDPLAKFRAYQALPEGEQAAYRGYLEATRPPGVTVQVGEQAKPLGTDAAEWRNPAGEPAPPGMTQQAAIAEGYEPLTPEAKTRATERVKVDETMRRLDAEVVRTDADLAQARERFAASPTPENRRAVENAAAANQAAIAGRVNWRGEPSEGIAERFDVPGPIRGWLERGVSAVLGGDEAPAPMPPAVTIPAAPAPRTAAPTPLPPPAVGAVEEGYEFLGGDPADPGSWRKR